MNLPIHLPLKIYDEKLFEKIEVPPLKERRFHLSKESIGRLKDKANSEMVVISISSSQAYLAHLLGSIIRCRKLDDEKEVFISVIIECNLVGNPCEWWTDSGATPYVCANKELFSSFSLAQVEKMIYMANSATAKVEGTGKVGLKMISRKVLTLNNILYVPELCRNLISASLLDKNGF
ncbi:hypothetical protein CQW23_18813 [Capsicum baccatum]|uniref:Retrovirus-related Pol polyprotein from transposon TNT 1-94-like beta-barrel domain-containing protein n=1 Tax=Capsicum baccatum TaxID=33114 RepID=A0A2G2W447_CAPBA|nr:hypothetical protein CQW23_34049 [Capsicum baccatum]PHT39959.1 hypothetical protein CQW23_18813 [Capsicum baccatum]